MMRVFRAAVMGETITPPFQARVFVALDGRAKAVRPSEGLIFIP
jgi:hypothetical protein